MRIYALAALIALAASPAGAGDTFYTVSTIAGTDSPGDGRAAVAAQLGQPQGLAFDRAGNLYIADAADHRVRKVTPAGVISTVAGAGRAGFRGDGGPASAALLNQPYGLAVDPGGSVYVADLGNSRVRKITPDGIIFTVAGGGARLPSAEGGDAAQAQLAQPRNLALDGAGNLFVSDYADHCIYKVTPEGNISRIAGGNGAGSSGENVPAISAQLNAPTALVVDGSGSLLVADSGNHRIRRIAAGIITTAANTAGLSSMPAGLAMDAAGTLFIATQGYVLRLTPMGIRPYAGVGPGESRGDGGPAVFAVFKATRDLALDPAGNLYVSDERRVRKVAAITTTVATFAGDGTFRPFGDGGQAKDAHLGTPSALALDREGNLYLADQDNFRVRKISPAGIITTVAGRGDRGSSGDGGPATAAPLQAPAALATDLWGNLWIADGNRVRKVSAGGIINTVVGGQPGTNFEEGAPAMSVSLSGPAGLAADGAGNLYIADTHNYLVRKLGPNGSVFSVVGKGVRGAGGDGGPAGAAQLNLPRGLALDAGGSLYIADSANHCIRKVTFGPEAGASVITTVAGTGTAGFAGDGGPAASARLSWPSRVALDPSGNLYIADTGNNRIRKVSPDGIITTIAGTGGTGVETESGPALSVDLGNPVDIAVDASGSVYVADAANARIRKLTPAAGTVVPPATVEVQAVRVVNAASLIAGPVAPGQIVSIFGFDLGPAAGVASRLKPSGVLETALADIEVLFDGRPAPLLYVQANQINAVAPFGLKPQAGSSVEVRWAGAVIGQAWAPTAEAAPAIFTSAGGAGPAAAFNEDGSINSPFNPAPRASLVTLFATGQGAWLPAGVDGKLAEPPLARPALPVVLRIGGQRADVLFAGAAPGTAGVLQLNVRIPEFVPPGSQAVELAVGLAPSQPGVTVAVR